jgi:hypothetical protein
MPTTLSVEHQEIDRQAENEKGGDSLVRWAQREQGGGEETERGHLQILDSAWGRRLVSAIVGG